MDVTESTLRGILEGSKQYLVPMYQRPYAWKSANWAKIWDDLHELALHRRSAGSTSHFTGTLVLEAGTVTTEVTRFLVVDGQQRLTTLSVLLAAIVEQHKLEGDLASATRLRDQVLINPYVSAVNEKYRLRPANFDEDVYRGVVDGLNPHSEDSLIDNCFRFFSKRVAALGSEDVTLQELESAALNGLKFVTITAKADDNVYRIFESINNTGIDLTQADLIRNLVFSRLESRAEEVHERIWNPLQKSLTSEDIESLFWIEAQWDNAELRRSDTYDHQKKKILALGQEELILFLEKCLKIANGLRRIRLITPDPHPGIRLHLKRIEELAMPGSLVLRSRILYLQDTGAISADDASGALKVLESYLVRRAIGSVPISNLQGINAACAHDLFGDAEREVHRILSTGRKKYLTDSQVREVMETHPIYERGRKPRLALILGWLLEERQGKDSGLDYTTMSIEHVLPQKLTGKAKEEFAAQITGSEGVDEVHENLVHTIGNLTLTNYNSELSNSAFSEKRVSWLSNTAVMGNRDIAANEHWGPLEIIKRSKDLADLATRIWPGPDEGLLEQEPESIGRRIDEVVSSIPSGHWTSYGDIAKFLGTASQVVGQRVSKELTNGAWRVLRANGEIAPGFKWAAQSPNQGRDLKSVLEQEGVIFDERGYAADEQRLRPEQLEELVGEL
jgi:alkylated DNA nucleotide flippase Atl1